METSASLLPSSTAAPQHQPDKAAIQLRQLAREDIRALHDLICACPPLDVNSLYAYALLALHHSATCFVAVRNGRLCGAVTGYVKPAQPDTYFLWQIAIAVDEQGNGLGSALLDHVARNCLQPKNLQFLETTIAPGNRASQSLFRRFAQRHKVSCQQLAYLSSSELQPIAEAQDLPIHEAEDLYRLGPWSQSN